eukprot:TRINITY_DN5791_c0_g1_i1.p1 TRINITY_DN5791_c0_g1~~TRINITY_DN5791_c0_g1_i1.p1  ORF type:complete len:517 (+),score=117.52 TRINITY_DN5791_c0_g1_i1:1012-2562(+)
MDYFLAKAAATPPSDASPSLDELLANSYRDEEEKQRGQSARALPKDAETIRQLREQVSSLELENESLRQQLLGAQSELARWRVHKCGGGGSSPPAPAAGSVSHLKGAPRQVFCTPVHTPKGLQAEGGSAAPPADGGFGTCGGALRKSMPSIADLHAACMAHDVVLEDAGSDEVITHRSRSGGEDGRHSRLMSRHHSSHKARSPSPLSPSLRVSPPSTPPAISAAYSPTSTSPPATTPQPHTPEAGSEPGEPAAAAPAKSATLSFNAKARKSVRRTLFNFSSVTDATAAPVSTAAKLKEQLGSPFATLTLSETITQLDAISGEAEQQPHVVVVASAQAVPAAETAPAHTPAPESPQPPEPPPAPKMSPTPTNILPSPPSARRPREVVDDIVVGKHEHTRSRRNSLDPTQARRLTHGLSQMDGFSSSPTKSFSRLAFDSTPPTQSPASPSMLPIPALSPEAWTHITSKQKRRPKPEGDLPPLIGPHISPSPSSASVSSEAGALTRRRSLSSTGIQALH